jgi:hypothetical protein
MIRLWALCLLAWALVRSVCTWPLRRRRALARFQSNYAAEGLLPVRPEVHQALTSIGGCIACGRCDRIVPGGDAARLEVPRASGVPLSQLVRAFTRSLPDAPLGAREFSRYSESELEAAEALCPASVSITGLRRLVERQAAAMSEAGSSALASH